MHATRTRGFTLIELMVTLAVMAIIVALAFPSFESVVNSNRLAGAANELMASLQTARMESLRFNKRGVVCFSSNANAASPTCSSSNPTGWIAFIDVDKNGGYNSGDTLLRATIVSGPVQILGSSNVAGKVVFRSDGMARDGTGALLMGAIDICLPTNKPASNVTRVTIGSGSRVSTGKVNTNASCATAPANPT